MPSATSSAIDPVGITDMGTAGRSPRRITEPLPNCLSICARARSSAFSRSGTAAIAATPVGFAVFFSPGVFTRHTLGGVCDTTHVPRTPPVDKRVLWTIPVHVYDAKRRHGHGYFSL